MPLDASAESFGLIPPDPSGTESRVPTTVKAPIRSVDRNPGVVPSRMRPFIGERSLVRNRPCPPMTAGEWKHESRRVGESGRGGGVTD